MTTSPSGFFDSLRNGQLRRGSNSVVGGVCAGLSRRYGWDLNLIRAATAIFTIFVPPIAFAYALGWMFLPNEVTGQIHAEEARFGRFNAAHLGGLFFALVGLNMVGAVLGLPLLIPGLVFDGISTGLKGLSLLAAAGIILVPLAILAYYVLKGKGNKPAADPTMTTPPAQTDFLAHGGTDANPYATPQNSDPVIPAPMYEPAPQTSTPYVPYSPQPAVPPITVPVAPAFQARRARTVSSTVNLLVTGLIIVLIAGTFYTMRYFFNNTPSSIYGLDVYGYQTALVGAGTCLIVVGVAIALAAFRDRGATWLIIMSVIGIFLALPASSASLYVNEVYNNSATSHTHGDASAVSTQNVNWQQDHVVSTPLTDELVIDLRDAPVNTVKSMEIVGVNVRRVLILARSDQLWYLNLPQKYGSSNIHGYMPEGKIQEGAMDNTPFIASPQATPKNSHFINLNIETEALSIELFEPSTTDHAQSSGVNSPAMTDPSVPSSDSTQSAL